MKHKNLKRALFEYFRRVFIEGWNWILLIIEFLGMTALILSIFGVIPSSDLPWSKPSILLLLFFAYAIVNFSVFYEILPPVLSKDDLIFSEVFAKYDKVMKIENKAGVEMVNFSISMKSDIDILPRKIHVFYQPVPNYYAVASGNLNSIASHTAYYIDLPVKRNSDSIIITYLVQFDDYESKKLIVFEKQVVVK